MIQMNLGAFMQSIKATVCGFIFRHKSIHRRKMQAAALSLYIHCKKWETKLQYTSKVYSNHLGNTLLQDLIHPVMLYWLQTKGMTMEAFSCSTMMTSVIKSSMEQQTIYLLKFHACLVCLLQLGYDVAIQPCLNYSSNPDFESCIGEFG